jgi:hypothetical protein
MAYNSTKPLPGDSNHNLLGKLVQLFGGAYSPGDTDNVLLQKLLRLADAAEPCDCAGGGGVGGSSTVAFSFALTGNEDAVAVIPGVENWRAPFAFTITEVRASLNDPATGGTPVQVDINKNGVTILSTKLTIDNNEVTSVTATTPAVISDTAVADDDELTFDIDEEGNNLGTGLKVTIIATPV